MVKKKYIYDHKNVIFLFCQDVLYIMLNNSNSNMTISYSRLIGCPGDKTLNNKKKIEIDSNLKMMQRQ